MTGWGAGPWGATPWGGGSRATALRLLSARAIRENVFRLKFDQPVYWSGHGDLRDAANLARYGITVVAGTTGIDGQAPRVVRVAAVSLVDANVGDEIDVTTDRPMSPFGAGYLVSVNGLRGTSGTLLLPGATSQSIEGMYRGLNVPLPDMAVRGVRDFANPQTRSGTLDPLPDPEVAAKLGTFPTDEAGDYAADEGIESVKKRILRRLTTRKGAFAHLPGYGVSIPNSIKMLARSGTLESLAADAEEQIRREPEVVSASVRLVQQGSITRFVVKARTRLGSSIDMPVPFVSANVQE